MVFSSSVFLFAFLPVVLIVYFLLPKRTAKNVCLLVASLFFYAWGEPVYILLMVASIAVNWLLGIQIGKAGKANDANASDNARRKKALLVVAVAFNVAVIGFFKYEGFVAQNINALLGMQLVPDLELPLPIGISFYTLQALSYVIDVYRGKVESQRNPLFLGMYISCFPQLVAGPIVRYAHIASQITDRKETLDGFAQGARLFVVGLGKKALLANTAGMLASALLAQPAPQIGWVGCFSGILAYTFQIYFDFSGYSDMAIGLGKMLGFDYVRNFNYPYISKSVTEFWRRWHISLGSFFRDYVYIPLGGNRVTTRRWLLNILIVWALTGIWHGAAWNFLLWGLYYGVLLIIEKLFLLKWLEKAPGIVGHIWCILTFFFGWCLFAVVGLENIGQWYAGLFGAYGFTGTSTLWELESWQYISLIPIMIVASTPIIPWLRKRIEAWAEGKPASEAGEAAPLRGNEMVPPCTLQVENPVDEGRARVATAIAVVADIALLAVLVLSCMSIVSSSYNPFIYFQF